MSTVTRSARAAVDIEDNESTKSEKLLAVVLAIFLLVGAVWTYEKIDDVVRKATKVTLSQAEELALARFNDAQTRASTAQQRVDAARAQLELDREAYRTALDAGQPAGRLEEVYRASQDRYEEAQAALSAAETEVESGRPAAEAASEHQAQAFDHNEVITFLARLAFVLAALAGSYLLLGRMRKRRSRYFPLALAVVGAAALLAIVLTGDYLTDYVDPVALGPLVLAIVGIGLTLAAFAALQRYLARRVPIRRDRKHECPFCGYPVGQNEHCEGCGREVVAECATCSEPRRVGTLHCGACGQA
jgi:hypothetical protein